MGGRVTKKHTRCRTWRKFVWSCGGEIRIAAPKNAQVGVIRWLAMKKLKGDSMLYGRTWSVPLRFNSMGHCG
jgi:hypothetical protein